METIYVSSDFATCVGGVYRARTLHLQKFTNCESRFSCQGKKKKKPHKPQTRRLEHVNILLSTHLLLLPSHRHAEVTDTSRSHKPPASLSHKLGVDKGINPAAL